MTRPSRQRRTNGRGQKAFYKAVADGLHGRLDLRREDVFINLVEVKKEDWSFGNGVAQCGV
jgi:4-oxalocrotonate tautomerase